MYRKLRFDNCKLRSCTAIFELNPSDSSGKEESVQTEEEEDFCGYFWWGHDERKLRWGWARTIAAWEWSCSSVYREKHSPLYVYWKLRQGEASAQQQQSRVCVSLYRRTSVRRTSSGPHSAHLCSYNFGDPALKYNSGSFLQLHSKAGNDEDGRLHNSSDRIYGEQLVGRDPSQWLLQILGNRSRSTEELNRMNAQLVYQDSTLVI